jgi:hypothetical protein
MFARIGVLAVDRPGDRTDAVDADGGTFEMKVMRADGSRFDAEIGEPRTGSCHIGRFDRKISRTPRCGIM